MHEELIHSQPSLQPRTIRPHFNVYAATVKSHLQYLLRAIACMLLSMYMRLRGQTDEEGGVEGTGRNKWRG